MADDRTRVSCGWMKFFISTRLKLQLSRTLLLTTRRTLPSQGRKVRAAGLSQQHGLSVRGSVGCIRPVIDEAPNACSRSRPTGSPYTVQVGAKFPRLGLA